MQDRTLFPAPIERHLWEKTYSATMTTAYAKRLYLVLTKIDLVPQPHVLSLQLVEEIYAYRVFIFHEPLSWNGYVRCEATDM